MNVFTRAISWVLGNGYDLRGDEDTVLRHKKDAKVCMKESETHFSMLQKKFTEVTPDPSYPEPSGSEFSSKSLSENN
jgi:hypothetical protein